MSQLSDTTVPLMCQVDDARVLTKVLTAIHFKQNQTATFVVTDSGFKVYTESSMSVQACGWLRKELFSEYEFSPTSDASVPMFGCNLTLLLQCLSTVHDEVATHTTAVKLVYAGSGNPLVLMLEENGVTTDCGLMTLVVDEPINFEFLNHTMPNKLIIKSDVLRDALSEFDSINSGTQVQLQLDSEAQAFVMSVDGALAACELEIPASAEVVTKLECHSTQSHRYRLSLLLLAIKSLGLSRDTCIRMNSQGVLSLQLMILLSNQLTAIVEFLICPSVEEDAI